MNTSKNTDFTERCSAKWSPPRDGGCMFQFLFERTSDETGAVVDCNEATAMLMRSTGRADLIGRRLEEFATPEQKGGSSIVEAVQRIAERFESRNSKFDWKARRLDGTEVTLEGNATAVERDGATVIVLVSREAGERKEPEGALLESAAGFGSFFERNADAMSLFDPQTLRTVGAAALPPKARRRSAVGNQPALSDRTVPCRYG
jgi:PAS domain-containing protein